MGSWKFRRRRAIWRRWSGRAIAAAALCVAMPAACASEKVIQTPTSPSTPTPTPAPAPAPQGPVRVSASPGTAGIAAVTTFTFTAINFVARSGSLRFSWDFGDGTSDSTTTAQVTHRFQGAGTFAVRVFGSDGQGVIDTASASGVHVVNLSGPWALRRPDGSLLIERGMSLTQDGATLRGDITPYGSCLIGVTGGITPDGVMSLAFTLVHEGCLPTFALPLPSAFSGQGNAVMEAFTGTLTGVGPAVVARCPTGRPGVAPCL